MKVFGVLQFRAVRYAERLFLHWKLWYKTLCHSGTYFTIMVFWQNSDKKSSFLYIPEINIGYSLRASYYILQRGVKWTPLSTPDEQHYINTLSPRQNGRHFADDIFKCIFLNENTSISINISLKFVPQDRMDNIPA